MHAIGHYMHAIWASCTPLPYSQSKVLRLVISTPWVLHLSLPWGSPWAVVSEIPALHDRPGVNDHNELWGYIVHNVVSIAVLYRRSENFRVKNFRRSTVLQRSTSLHFFHSFNFRCSACGRKYLTVKISRSTVRTYSVWQLRIQWRVVLVPDLQLTWIARSCTPVVFDKCNCKQNLPIQV